MDEGPRIEACRILEPVRAEGDGGEVGGVDEVDLGVVAPGVADIEGMGDGGRGRGDVAGFDRGGCGMELAVGTGQLEGAGRGSVGGREALVVIEADTDRMFFDGGERESGACIHDVVTMEAGEGEAGETVADGLFVTRVNVDGITDVDGEGLAGVRE